MLPAGTNPQNQYTRSVDIFAFGLCVLELATKQKLDSHNAAVWPELLETVQDDETRSFIHRYVPLRCLLAADAGFSACFLLATLLQAQKRPLWSTTHSPFVRENARCPLYVAKGCLQVSGNSSRCLAAREAPVAGGPSNAAAAGAAS